MEKKEELYEKLSKTIKEQIDKLDKLDIYTSKHVHNVPKIVEKICNKLNFSEIEILFCIRCAYLHDIGKIFIPPEILQKPDDLTKEEFDIMKTHTIKGYELCSSTEHLKIYSRAVRSHHENADGTGYPDKLVSKQIPLEAEIIKVADIYDALISKRQYKEGYSRKTSMQILKEETDKNHINKNIFKALLRVILDDIEEDKKNNDGTINLRALMQQKLYINNVLEKY